MPSPSAPFCPNLHMLTNLEALQTTSFWVFMEAALHRHDWWNNWLLVINSTSSLSSPEVGVGAQNSNPLFTQLVWPKGPFLLLPNPSSISGSFYLQGRVEWCAEIGHLLGSDDYASVPSPFFAISWILHEFLNSFDLSLLTCKMGVLMTVASSFCAGQVQEVK